MEKISHECKRNKIPGISILYGPSIDSDWEGWVLENKLLATDQDVKSGEAELVGEELSCSIIAVEFCPFCGEALSEQRSTT